MAPHTPVCGVFICMATTCCEPALLYINHAQFDHFSLSGWLLALMPYHQHSPPYAAYLGSGNTFLSVAQSWRNFTSDLAFIFFLMVTCCFSFYFIGVIYVVLFLLLLLLLLLLSLLLLSLLLLLLLLIL